MILSDDQWEREKIEFFITHKEIILMDLESKPDSVSFCRKLFNRLL